MPLGRGLSLVGWPFWKEPSYFSIACSVSSGCAWHPCLTFRKFEKQTNYSAHPQGFLCEEPQVRQSVVGFLLWF